MVHNYYYFSHSKSLQLCYDYLRYFYCMKIWSERTSHYPWIISARNSVKAHAGVHPTVCTTTGTHVQQQLPESLFENPCISSGTPALLSSISRVLTCFFLVFDLCVYATFWKKLCKLWGGTYRVGLTLVASWHVLQVWIHNHNTLR